MYKIPANTLFMGHPLVFMPECHSTNDEAAQRLKTASCTEGTVIITNKQTAGRGQRNSQWIAEPGANFTFSIVLKPTFLTAMQQFQLNRCIALGIADYLLNTLQQQVHIKWPNDIMVSDKKVCGILIENSVSGQMLQHSIIGIGLNVNQEELPFDRATSMTLQTGRRYDLSAELPKLLGSLEARYLMLKRGDSGQLEKNYLERLYWLGETRVFVSNGTEFQGTIIGLDAVGKLLIQHSSGNLNSFSVKEVEFIR